MKITITTPFPADSLQGNAVSAQRIAQFLRDSGHSVVVHQNGFEDDCELLIALNGWRSAKTIAEYRAQKSIQHGTLDQCTVLNGSLVVMMTGSDLFPLDGLLKPETLASIKSADAVVVTHRESVDTIDHSNIWEIGKSIVIPSFAKKTQENESTKAFLGLIVAHLREQKNPFLYLRSLPYLKEIDGRIRVEHYGDAKETSYREDALRYQSDAYQWRGLLPRDELLSELAQADFLLNTSYIEGSSNSLGEALVLGVPVIASAISGNVGVLGKDYPGLYKVDDPKALAMILKRFVNESGFREELTMRCADLAKTLSPEREKKQWAELVDSLLPPTK